MFLADFHMHSQFSDGKMSITQLVDEYGRRGFGAIAITDHLCESRTFLGQSALYLNKSLRREQFRRYLLEIEAEAQRAWRQYCMVVIPGVEFTKNSFSHKDSAHILALGLREFVDPDLSVDELLLACRQARAVTVAAHPVSTRKMEHQTYHLWHQRDRLSQWIDAWEVASGSTLFDEVFASGLPMLANSDLHQLRQMSSWKTVMSCERSESQILAAIRAQDLNFTYYEDPQAAWLSQALSVKNVQTGLSAAVRLKKMPALGG
jgi:hypothetical protein